MGFEPRAETLRTGLLSACLSAIVTFGICHLAQAAVPSIWATAKPLEAITIPTAPAHALSRRSAGALALSVVGAAWPGAAAFAAPQRLAIQAESGQVSVWLGNGCFWGRQFDFTRLEKEVFGRTDATVTALVGYAGGTKAGSGGLNCYFGGPLDSLYELNGQAEVVQLQLDAAALEDQFRAAMKVYFGQFQRIFTGQMIRQDPQDLGPAYRSVLGLPGGIKSPLMDIVRQENVNKMQLREGSGDDGDNLNVVWVMDTNRFPFYRAEQYHQFHRGLGRESFPPEYLRDLKQAQAKLGRIDPTGCPEVSMFST